MTEKAKVLTRYPHAVAERDGRSAWTVWDIPRELTHGVRFNGDVARTRGLFGLGKTECEAWADAVRKIEMRECKRLFTN